jgi:hypothetical protein
MPAHREPAGALHRSSECDCHGYRTSFRTWCSKVAHLEFELAELCLSHRIGSAISHAYNRTTMTERRRPIMSAWANYIEGDAAANVVPFRAAAGE